MNTDKPDVIKYLLGEGTLLGCWWGEKPNWIGTAKFWWRKPLRETFEQTQSKISSLESALAFADEELSRLKTGKESQLVEMLRKSESDRERLLSALKDTYSSSAYKLDSELRQRLDKLIN